MKAIAIMGLNDAKAFQKQCEKHGVEIVLNHNDSSCQRGCAVTVELHAHEKDLEKVQQIYSQNFMDMAKDLDVDWKAISSVYDPNASEVTCPACGHKYDPAISSNECPDCGLCF